MALSLGSALATKVYLGATEVSQAYLGATQVYTSVPPSFLLDDYTGAAAGYSLRNLSSSWTTSDVVEVRRSSDNATSGFTATEVSDGTMLAWVGTGGTDNGFVTTWYDQSGNTNNAVQATTTKQPKIVSAGAVVVENSKPALSFDGGDYFQDTFAVGTTNTGFIVGKAQVADAFFDDIAVVNGNNIRTISATEVRYTTNSGGGGTANYFIHTVPSGTWNNQNLISYISDGANSQVGVNGSATTGSVANPTNVTGVTIGAAQNGNAGVTGTMQEVIVYASNQLSNTFNIEANINTEYSIYTQEFSEEAQNYFNRLNGAGDTTYTAYKEPLANYIDSLVALGGAYWDDMESAASFVGVGIQGVTVPLKSTMTALTNNNFVAGDLDPLTGLKGDGSTKYLDTGSKFNDFPQNDFSMSCNITEFIQETTDGNYLAYQSFGDGISQISTQNDQGVNPNNLITRCNTRNGEINFDIGNLEDLYGINRTVSTEYSVQYGASSKTVTEPSQAPANQIISILGASTEVKSNARMATYHIGPALNLATLRGLQDTLITEIAATFNTLVYQSDFANGATEYTAVRTTAVAPDSPDASTNVISLTPKVDTANYYIRLTTSNVNTSDTYLTKFDVFIAAGQAFDGIEVKDWIGTVKFAKTLAGSELGQWVSVSFTTTYPDYGQPAIYLTNAGSVSFVGNNSDVAYIRNLEILEQS